MSITQEEYLQFKKKWEADIAFHQRKLETIDTAENGYYANAIYLLEICSNAATLFKYAEPAEKRELIGMVCQNLFWDGENLTFNLLKPFDAVYQHASKSLWQGRWFLVKTFTDEDIVVSEIEDVLNSEDIDS